MIKLIFIRNEISETELRAPLIPMDVEILIFHGFEVYVESSKQRVYKDIEYALKGAKITMKKWFDPMFKHAIIIGLKELTDLHFLDNHTHVYFSHCFKKQLRAEKVLSAFHRSNSKLYDFEYFKVNNKRVTTFGMYAGIIGCCVGLMQFKCKRSTGNNITNLSPFKNMNQILKRSRCLTDVPKINIMGPFGNVGLGVRCLLDNLGIPYTHNDVCFDKYDIVFNCINLHPIYNQTWISHKTKISKQLLICDISCDYNKSNNPIKIYNSPTTWKDPVYSFDDYIDIIAINNLPSLLPKESSAYFSNNFLCLLLSYHNYVWDDCIQFFDNLK